MVEAAPTAMILVDRTGRVVLANAEAERMFGYPGAALHGQPIELLLPAGARAHHADLRDDYQRAPAKRAMGGTRDLMGVRADGSELPIEVGLNPIDTVDGPCVLAVVTDISERRRAEQTRAHLAAIVESSDDAIVSMALDGTVTSWNRSAEQILGWPEREIVGKRIGLIIPPDRHDEQKQILERVRAGGSVEDLASVRLRCDGSLVPMSITASPIRDQRGRVTGASQILRDATERRRGERAMLQANAALELAVAERTRELAEQQEARRRAEAALAQSQKLEAVGQLTGGVAHDFNNLLTVIEGNLHLIHRHVAGNEALSRAIAGIERAVGRGSRLTGHLLAFARRQTLLPEVMRLDDVVRDFSLLAARAVGEAVRVSINADEDLWPCLIDRAQFESAVLNLSINARDAMPDGGGLLFTLRNVDWAGEADQRAGRYVSVQVTDTGLGMQAEVVARAVEPFFTTKEVGKGTGLGLSQVYGFVKQSGGAFRIDSRPGKGTSVTMMFPAAADAVTAAEFGQAGAATKGGHPAAAVMVVEDDPEVLALVSEALREAGHRVTCAHDGPEALALLADGAVPDLMVCDVVMPGQVSGVELGQRARRLRPATRVLLTSGYSREELNRLGGTADFSFLAKPFRPGDLVSQVRALLDAPG